MAKGKQWEVIEPQASSSSDQASLSLSTRQPQVYSALLTTPCMVYNQGRKGTNLGLVFVVV
jgi:hypothetical protein